MAHEAPDVPQTHGAQAQPEHGRDCGRHARALAQGRGGEGSGEVGHRALVYVAFVSCSKGKSSAMLRIVKAEGKKEVITQDEVMAQVSCLYRARQHK